MLRLLSVDGAPTPNNISEGITYTFKAVNFNGNVRYAYLPCTDGVCPPCLRDSVKLVEVKVEKRVLSRGWACVLVYPFNVCTDVPYVACV